MKDYLSLFVAAGIFLSGCEQSPIADAEKLTEQKPTLAEVKEVLPPYGLSAPDVMEFTEGNLGEYLIEAWVPSPANAIVTITGLPEGAVYNSAQSKISWRPGFDSANDSQKISTVMRFYPIEISVQSDQEKKVAPIKKNVVLVVKDNPRKFDLEFSSKAFKLTEGKEFEQTLKIISDDFPKGPFLVEIDGLPPGASLEIRENHSVFTIRWLPWYDVVSSADTWDEQCKCYQKTLQLEYKITNLRGQTITSPKVEWVISDRVPTRSGQHSSTVENLIFKWETL